MNEYLYMSIVQCDESIKKRFVESAVGVQQRAANQAWWSWDGFRRIW